MVNTQLRFRLEPLEEATNEFEAQLLDLHIFWQMLELRTAGLLDTRVHTAGCRQENQE